MGGTKVRTMAFRQEKSNLRILEGVCDRFFEEHLSPLFRDIGKLPLEELYIERKRDMEWMKKEPFTDERFSKEMIDGLVFAIRRKFYPELSMEKIAQKNIELRKAMMEVVKKESAAPILRYVDPMDFAESLKEAAEGAGKDIGTFELAMLTNMFYYKDKEVVKKALEAGVEIARNPEMEIQDKFIESVLRISWGRDEELAREAEKVVKALSDRDEAMRKRVERIRRILS